MYGAHDRLRLHGSPSDYRSHPLPADDHETVRPFRRGDEMSVSAWPTAVAVAVALVASVAYGCTSTASTPADAGDSDSGSSTALDGALDVASLPARPLVCPPSAVAFQPTAWPIPSWFDGGFPCANNQDLGVVLQCLILLPSDPRCPELMANTGACSACVL